MHLAKMNLYSYLQVNFQQRNNNKLAWNGNLIERINVFIFAYEFVLILRLMNTSSTIPSAGSHRIALFDSL